MLTYHKLGFSPQHPQRNKKGGEGKEEEWKEEEEEKEEKWGGGERGCTERAALPFRLLNRHYL